MNDAPVNLQSPTYTPRRLLEELMWVLHAPRREQLARALDLDTGLISRIWNHKAPLTYGVFVRIMDRTGWSIAYVRELAGMPFEGDFYPPRPRTVSVMPKSGANPHGVIILPKKPRDYHLAKEHILQAMPGTVDELAKRSGYHRNTVQIWLKVLRAGDPATRASHIEDWLPPAAHNGGGVYLAVHGAGPGEDATYALPHHRDRPRRLRNRIMQPTAAQHSTN
jgi:hypothetical protein